MGAALDDSPAVEHEDFVSIANGAQAMRNLHHRMVTSKDSQRVVHQTFGLGIERRRRLIKQYDGCVLIKRSCDGNSLSLPAREQAAALANDAIKTAWQRLDKCGRTCRLGRPLNTGTGYRAAVCPRRTKGNVGCDRIVDQEYILRDQRKITAQHPGTHVFDRHVIHSHYAGFRFVKAR